MQRSLLQTSHAASSPLSDQPEPRAAHAPPSGLAEILWPRSRWMPGPGRQDGVQQFSYDDQIVRLFLMATLAWGLIAIALLAFAQLLLVVPRADLGLPVLAFGRVQPLAMHLAMFGLAGNAAFCGIYHATQRLLRARNWSDALARLHFWAWQTALLASLLTLPWGMHQRGAPAGTGWSIDLLMIVAWLGAFAPSFFMTVRHRRRRRLHVALWFFTAALIAVPFLLVVSLPARAGVQDVILQAIWRNGLWAFLLVAPFIGLLYHLLPQMAGRQLHSHRLAVLHFWALAVLLGWGAPRILHNTAMPEWLTSIGVAGGLPIWAVAVACLIVALAAARSHWRRLAAEPAMQFLIASAGILAIVGIDASLRSFKSVSAVAQYTDWAAGEMLITLIGFAGMIGFGLIYWLAPRLLQAPGLWSVGLARLHLWLAATGALLVLIGNVAGGMVQGMMWHGLSPEGLLEHPIFLDTVAAVAPFRWAVLAGLLLYLAGAITCCVNVLRTWQGGPALYEEPTITAPPRSAGADEPVAAPVSQWEGLHSVAPAAGRLQVFGTLWWHRRWEDRPGLLAWLLFLALAIPPAALLLAGSAISAAQSPPEEVEPLSPLELLGRDLYLAEGCHACHTQQVRPILPETRRYGPDSQLFESLHDRPALWGQRRVGPDLARVGGRYSHLWHLLHFENPQAVAPESIMPTYGHLSQRRLNVERAADRLKAQRSAGAIYPPGLVRFAADDARAQALKIAEELIQQGGPAGMEDRQVVALIAYLQRLGLDAAGGAP